MGLNCLNAFVLSNVLGIRDRDRRVFLLRVNEQRFRVVVFRHHVQRAMTGQVRQVRAYVRVREDASRQDLPHFRQGIVRRGLVPHDQASKAIVDVVGQCLSCRLQRDRQDLTA